MTDRPRTWTLYVCGLCGAPVEHGRCRCVLGGDDPDPVADKRVRVVEADPVIAALDGLEAHWRTDKDCVPCRETRRMVRELRGAICEDAVSRLRLGINLSQPACRVVECDRARVVPIIEQALEARIEKALADHKPWWPPIDLAVAVFDALTGNDE